jgi:uroporphyrin-III C-methyltransferase
MQQSVHEKVIGGGSLILAWRLKGRHVLVIGGGEIGERRVFAALEADAKVTVISPDVVPALQSRIDEEEVSYVNRTFQDTDLDSVIPATSDTSSQKWALVLAAIDDPVVSKEIYLGCNRRGIPANIADVPEFCDFYFMSTYRDKSLQVAVSTNGNAPRLAKRLRKEICTAIPRGAGQAIENVGILRQMIRKEDNTKESTEKRMSFMSNICDSYSINDLAKLTEQDYNGLVQKFLQTKNLPKSEPEKRAKLILVGAGPGDPDLLTRKAIRALHECDVVIADNLIPQAILDEIPSHVQLIVKPPIRGQAEEVQNDSNEWVLQALKQDKLVVRLKSGDPLLFGRGGEELNHFRSLGFDAEVIPGISSALSAPLVANIPVTHRGSANQVLISTGRGEKGTFPDLPPYCDKRTIVFLMGVRESPKVAEELLKQGYPADLPVAIVEKATMPNEKIIRCTIREVPETVVKEKIEPPATFIVGHVVNACVNSETKKDVSSTILKFL